MAGERARPVPWRHAWATDRPRDRPPPMPATTAPTPGWPVTTNSPRRHHAVSGEGWNPTARRTMAILPAALGWHHAPPNPRRQAAGELGAYDTTAARRRQRRTGPPRRGGPGVTGSGTTGQLPGPTHQLPPHRPPTHRPTPHPGRPSARPSQDRGGRAWRYGRRAYPGPASAGHGLHRSPHRRRTLHFLSVPVNWDRRCGWFSHHRLSQSEGGRARKQGGLYLPLITEGFCN